ncbi:hypothetical protein COB52_03675 [Candidatus Kaiserbacteria bacterium]|nr:MAG: hypothetical protein COB52_03675 [Candidatus Kaiserbacteria bacterium]
MTDKPSILKSFKLWKTDWGAPLLDSDLSEELEELDSYLDGSDQRKVMIGHFNQDLLLGDMQLFFWKTKPFWTSEYLRIYKHDDKYLSEETRRSLFDSMFELARKKGCRKYYYMLPSHWNNWTEHLYPEKSTEGNNWQHREEIRIEAESVPTERLHWLLMGRRSHPFDVTLYTGALKENEHTQKILTLNFEQILPIWKNQLWPDRKSSIDPTNAVDFDGEINLDLMNRQPFFYGSIEAGVSSPTSVISGLQTSKTRFRSRGIWVHPLQRRKGLGSLLLKKIENKAISLGCSKVWSMPRQSVVEFYLQNGFSIVSSKSGYEYGPHYLVEKNISGGS